MSITKPLWELEERTGNIEHTLFQDYIVEFTDISGIEIDYYIRDESISMDRLYGESVNTAYLTAKRTKIIYEPTIEATTTNTFGITSEEMIQYAFIPKYTFSRDVSGSDYYEPKPGDVIKTIWNNRNYEVIDVEEETQIFQVSKMIWGFLLKPYRFSEQSESAENITEAAPISDFGSNDWIEEQSNDIENYGDVDSSVYGF